MGSEKTIKIKIPKDVHVAWERDFSFLGCYLIAQQHLKELKRYIGVGYSMCAFFHDNSHVVFYRSEADEENFNRKIAERFLNEKGYADFAVGKLKLLTDNFDEFLKKEKRLTKDNVERFFEMANAHFSFHLAVFWSADYIAKHDLIEKNKSLYALLEKYRKYNEHVLPAIERWIAVQKGDISLMRPEECLDIFLRNKKIPIARAKARKNSAFVYFDKCSQSVSIGRSAKNLKEKFDRVFLKRYPFDGKSIKGIVVFPGCYRGRVRVAEKFEDLKKIKKGEILVAPMTRPAYNMYIRHAGAIIVDEGATLSHASILAREFSIPCVIGTKIATKVLKDGDLVEVDADNGIVKRFDKVNDA